MTTLCMSGLIAINDSRLLVEIMPKPGERMLSPVIGAVPSARVCPPPEAQSTNRREKLARLRLIHVDGLPAVARSEAQGEGWSPRLVSRQRLLLFREALICLSYSGVGCPAR